MKNNPLGIIYYGPDPIPLKEIMLDIARGLMVVACGALMGALFVALVALAHAGVI